MKKHFYLHSDGNGGLVISKILAAIIMVIGVVTPLITVIWFSATARADINSAQEKISELKTHEAADEVRFMSIEKNQVEYQTDMKYITQKVDKIDSKLDKVLETR